MASLKEQIAEKSAGLVKRETVTLPRCGVAVQVRGLMAGEQLRCTGADNAKSALLFAVLATEDPSTGKPIWNPNKAEDMAAAGQIHADDLGTIITAGRRLSGMDKESVDEIEKN